MKFIKTKRPFKPNTYAFTYEDLYEWRVVKRLSYEQIAVKFGCDHTTVVNACARLGVPKRGLIPPVEHPNHAQVSKVPSEKDAA